MEDETLPDINWKEVCERLGLSNVYEILCVEKPVERGSEPLWILPMVQGLTCERLANFLKEELAVNVGIDVERVVFGGKSNLIPHKDARHPSSGSYWAAYRRERIAITPVVYSRGRPLPDFGGITFLEYLFLWTGFYLHHGRDLEGGVCVVCSGSVCDEGWPPWIRWVETEGWLSLGWYMLPEPDCRYLTRKPEWLSL